MVNNTPNPYIVVRTVEVPKNGPPIVTSQVHSAHVSLDNRSELEDAVKAYRKHLKNKVVITSTPDGDDHDTTFIPPKLDISDLLFVCSDSLATTWMTTFGETFKSYNGLICALSSDLRLFRCGNCRAFDFPFKCGECGSTNIEEFVKVDD